MKNCPTCNGSGKIPEPLTDTMDQKRQTAKALRKAGYSIREIAKIMGYKYHNSITKLLETTEKTTL